MWIIPLTLLIINDCMLIYSKIYFNSFFCTSCIKYPPQVNACASLYLALIDFNKSFPPEYEWWELFDSTIVDIQSIAEDLENLYKKPIFKYIPYKKNEFSHFVKTYNKTGVTEDAGFALDVKKEPLIPNHNSDDASFDTVRDRSPSIHKTQKVQSFSQNASPIDTEFSNNKKYDSPPPSSFTHPSPLSPAPTNSGNYLIQNRRSSSRLHQKSDHYSHKRDGDYQRYLHPQRKFPPKRNSDIREKVTDYDRYRPSRNPKYDHHSRSHRRNYNYYSRDHHHGHDYYQHGRNDYQHGHND